MARLFINRFYSVCGSCGKQALPTENAHVTSPAWSGWSPGCGAAWDSVSSHYAAEAVLFVQQGGFSNLNGLPVYDFLIEEPIGVYGGQSRTRKADQEVSDV